jgi:hypothetical protein
VADPSLYLFDGYNLLHAGAFTEPLDLVDALASFVAMKGARGVLVFDGVGEDVERGPLSVRLRRTPTRCSSDSQPSIATWRASSWSPRTQLSSTPRAVR